MNAAERAFRVVDRFQQRRRWLAFAVAVWKKFGDDQAGNLAALIAYYAFVSLFPLLLVFVTVLDLVLRDNESLRERILSSALGNFPVLGQQLQDNIGGLHETGPALAIGLVLIFLGARGVANAVQNALNTVWEVPLSRRPGFPWNLLRSTGMVVGVGLGIVVTSVLSGLAAGSAQTLGGTVANVGAVVLSLALNISTFWLGFRLGTAREVTTRQLLPGVLASAVVWQILQFSGGLIVRHQLAHASALYGSFALVLGLIGWLFLQAEVTLYAVEASVVHARGLWPRSLTGPLTQEDRAAYTLYAKAGQRRVGDHIDVHLDTPK
ncbi:MAG TPA: YihY/virulence factor BrkB family protein, partial [Streptosporangiaceae bacterium]|nr:YihY/virulence factor BrkB family protein [Streptosporangiaceae bacterium]